MSLNGHVAKRHSNSVAQVTNQIYNYTESVYKTTVNDSYSRYTMEKSKPSWKHHQAIYEAIDSKSFSCNICNYTAFSKHHLIDHMNVHDNKNCVSNRTKKNHANASNRTAKVHLCNHCGLLFGEKRALYEHVLKKHPNFISSISSELHECTKCTFKTTKKYCFNKHLLKHLGLASDFKHFTCVHCNATLKSKKSLDYHVAARHPDFISCITSKLYECAKCTFKTTSKYGFDRHLLKHPGLASDFKHITCVHCNATFKSKTSLDDHVLRKHPGFVSSITSKLHECSKCTFKTTAKTNLVKHVKHIHHTKTNHANASNKTVKVRSFSCNHCDASFRDKRALYEHVLKKHPNFISSIHRKLHECTKCPFKTVRKDYLNRHLLEHPEVASNFKLSVCIHCNATFKSKKSLDAHVLRKHPDFITTVTTKLHECTECAFKTIKKSYFDKHLLKHSDFKHSKHTLTKYMIVLNASIKLPMEKSKLSWKQHQVINEAVHSESFSCYICNYTAFSKHQLVDHMNVHDNKNCVPGCIKQDHCNTTIKTVSPNSCSHCASFKVRKALGAVGCETKHKLSRCMHCNATFSYKSNLDEHIISSRPDSISSVTRKLHECTKCTFKTVKKPVFKKHLLRHPEFALDFKLNMCLHCNKTFKHKKSLDDHVVRKHPDFFNTVTSKLHECTKCPFKTVRKDYLNRHLLEHPEVASNFKLSVCIHCNATFKSKKSLDDHVLRKHPDFVTTVTTKLHECTECAFKTVRKSYFDKHLLKHSDFKHSTCAQ
nr:unnamed protein product [Callosobruchus analis]